MSQVKCWCGRPVAAAHKVSQLGLKFGSQRKYRLRPAGAVCACGTVYPLAEYVRAKHPGWLT